MSGLPGAELGSLHGAQVWRVRGKGLVQLGPRLRVPGEEDLVRGRGELVMLLVAPDEREALLQEDPETFFATPHYDGSPFILVWLRRVAKPRLRELLTDAWRLRASKAQIVDYDSRS